MSAPLLPLEVLLRTMRRKWEEGDYDGAVAMARAAAPYLHARATTNTACLDLRALSDEELEQLCETGACT